jgi:hypothetical protein
MDRVVDPQQRHRSLERRLETAHLAHRRLEHARAQIVPHLSVEEVQPIAHQLPLWVARGRVLSGVVVGSEFCCQVGRVFRGVDGEGFGDYEEGCCKFGDGELFARALSKAVRVDLELKSTTYERGGKVLEVDAQRCLNGSSTRDDHAALERTLNNRKRIVNGALHLIQHIIICATQND